MDRRISPSQNPKLFPALRLLRTMKTRFQASQRPPARSIITARHGNSLSPSPSPPTSSTRLSSLRYMVKYGTKFDDGNSTVQTDVVLSTKAVPGGVSKIGGDIDAVASVYRAVESGYAPRIVTDGSGAPLVTVSAVKCNGGSEQWSHFVDGQELRPNIRLVDPTARLYFIFNVAEYPTKDTERFLAVEIAASWFEDDEARAEKDEADRLAAEEAAKNRTRSAINATLQKQCPQGVELPKQTICMRLRSGPRTCGDIHCLMKTALRIPAPAA
ncbi:hypothetical protein PTI98_013079 [Pleurotus ostreatus]|nr:hypothetical protein PTI98_013079 [Pleurotus ostreatus]